MGLIQGYITNRWYLRTDLSHSVTLNERVQIMLLEYLLLSLPKSLNKQSELSSVLLHIQVQEKSDLGKIVSNMAQSLALRRISLV